MKEARAAIARYRDEWADASRTTPPEAAIVSTRPRAGAGGGHAGRGASTPRPGDPGGRASDSDQSGSDDGLLHGVVIRLLDPDEQLRVAPIHVGVMQLGEFPVPLFDLVLGRG